MDEYMGGTSCCVCRGKKRRWRIKPKNILSVAWSGEDNRGYKAGVINIYKKNKQKPWTGNPE